MYRPRMACGLRKDCQNTMRQIRRAGCSVLLIALAALLAACSENKKPTDPTIPLITSDSTPAYVISQRAEILSLTNQQRGSAGVGALAGDTALDRVAQAHAQDMAVRDFFSHTNPDGQDPFDRLQAAGIVYSTAGENIGWYWSAASVVDAWVNSPGHYANMVYGGFGKIGIGVYKLDPQSAGNYYYVQLFTN